MAKYPLGLATRFRKKRRAVHKRKASRKAYTFTRRTHKLRKGPHRPIVLWTGRKFRRPKRSRVFRHSVRINPRRRYRSNPLNIYSVKHSVMTALPVVGGVALSMFAMPQIVKYVPASMQKYSKYFGAFHIVLGVAAMSFVKKDVVKTLGGTMIAMGLYDLLAANVPQLKLPQLPRGAASTAGADEIVGASFEEIGTDFTPAGVGSSYGSSYGGEIGDDIDYGGDSIEIG